jgi:hypothetical protein
MSYKNGLFFFHVLYSFAHVSKAMHHHHPGAPFTFVDNLGLGICILDVSLGDYNMGKLMSLPLPTFHLNSNRHIQVIVERQGLRLTYCPSRPSHLLRLRAP